MRRILMIVFTAASLVLGAPLIAQAPPSATGAKLGIGISVFDPTAVNVVYRLDTSKRVEFALGFGERMPYAHALFLFNVAPLSELESFHLYTGAGFVAEARPLERIVTRRAVIERSENSAGLALPLGLSYLTPAKNLELYGALQMNVFASGRVDSELAISFGFRVYP